AACVRGWYYNVSKTWRNLSTLFFSSEELRFALLNFRFKRFSGRWISGRLLRKNLRQHIYYTKLSGDLVKHFL
ncbi:MAG TPA: hypothetical protein DCG50_05470, partial [Elusimicrobia bacterium]|nr:hypothetical protein [Elusimicrobiota bacterium]